MDKGYLQEVEIDDDQDLTYFSESLASIFDDIPVCNGDAEHPYIYESIYGVLPLRLTATMSWEEQLKFSHFVWRAELTLAKRIESGDLDLRGLRVLELGAGAGLCGILSCFAGAADVVLSDYAAESMLTNLTYNVDTLLPADLRANATVVGHTWGEDVSPLLEAGRNKGPFDVILLADCLWMPEQHEALCHTLCAVLAKSHFARICCVAGFHSGRRKLANFFSLMGQYGLTTLSGIKEINHRHEERKWDADRSEEDSVERKRWLVMADLVKEEKHVTT